MTTNTTMQEQPKSVYSHTLMYPGVPLSSLISMTGLLLGAYGVQHQLAIDPNLTSEQITSGDKIADQRFMNEYMAFKNSLDSLSRDYTRIVCTAQSNGTALYLHLYCY
uniref:Uncharacterized protein n=1 Tax=Pantoea phage Survivor TaxID=3232176 RepID=A0AAU8KZ11_9CAUD